MWQWILTFSAEHPMITFLVICLVGYVIGLQVIVLNGVVASQRGFRRRRYRVRAIRGQGYVYEEGVPDVSVGTGGVWRDFVEAFVIMPRPFARPYRVFRFSRLEKAPSTKVSVPDELAWNENVPDWARGRREEILSRIHERLLDSGH